MPEPRLPSGTVAFLFIDIEGSTKRWQSHRDAMGEAVARHDAPSAPPTIARKSVLRDVPEASNLAMSSIRWSSIPVVS